MRRINTACKCSTGSSITYKKCTCISLEAKLYTVLFTKLNNIIRAKATINILRQVGNLFAEQTVIYRLFRNCYINNKV